MSAFSSKATLRLAPRPNGSTSMQAAQTPVTVTGTSSAEIAIPGAGIDHRYITIRPTLNCHIAFDVAGMGAATTNDMLFFAGQSEDYVVEKNVTHLRVIKAAGATDGPLYWAVSSPT